MSSDDEYIRRWIQDHPGPWHQCPACGAWRMTLRPAHCSLCPPKPKERRRTRSWERRGAGDDQGHTAGPYAQDDE